MLRSIPFWQAAAPRRVGLVSTEYRMPLVARHSGRPAKALGQALWLDLPCFFAVLGVSASPSGCILEANPLHWQNQPYHNAVQALAQSCGRVGRLAEGRALLDRCAGVLACRHRGKYRINTIQREDRRKQPCSADYAATFPIAPHAGR